MKIMTHIVRLVAPALAICSMFSSLTAENTRVVALDAALQKIAGGFTWAEGPVEDTGGESLFHRQP